MSRIGKFLALIITTVVAYISTGLVLMYSYHRLIVPSFPMMPHHVGLAAAISVAAVVSYLTMSSTVGLLGNEAGIEWEQVFIMGLIIDAIMLVSAFVLGFFV